MVANTAALVFKTPGACFEIGSSVKWLLNAASNGAAQLTKAVDCTASLATNDNTLTLTGLQMVVQVMVHIYVSLGVLHYGELRVDVWCWYMCCCT